MQPHAGAAANLAAYQALLEPGDTVLAMRLDQGGHLTHGSPASITSKIWRFVAYGVSPATGDPDKPGEIIDFDQVADIARREHPALIVAGSTAYSRIIDPLPFREIADSVGARFMYDAAHPAGLIAGGVHPSPVGIADVVTLTTHKTLRGPRGGAIMTGAELAKSIDSAVFPGLQGGPLEHVIAAKAVAFAEAARPEFREYAAKVVANARVLAVSLAEAGFRLVSGGTDNHQVLVDLRDFDPELTGKVAQETLDRARDHLQPQHDPRRSPLAVRDLGSSPRHGGGDHRRHGRGRDAARRSAHRQDPPPPRRRGRARSHSQRGPCAVLGLPALRGARRRVRPGRRSSR